MTRSLQLPVLKKAESQYSRPEQEVDYDQSQIFILRRFFTAPATPASPVPSSSIVVGSGTALGGRQLTLPTSLFGFDDNAWNLTYSAMAICCCVMPLKFPLNVNVALVAPACTP